MSDTPMVERETMSGLRERIAEWIRVVRHQVVNGVVVLPTTLAVTDYDREAADRILSDPELSRALREVAEVSDYLTGSPVVPDRLVDYAKELYARIDELESKLARVMEQEPVAWATRSHEMVEDLLFDEVTALWVAQKSEIPLTVVPLVALPTEDQP